MKICILSSESMFDGGATANRVLSFAKAFSEREDIRTVSIVCPRGRVAKNGSSHKFRIGEVGGQVVRKKNLLVRAIDEIFLSCKVWRHEYVKDANVVLITIPSILLLVPLLIRHSSPKIIAIDVRDAVWTYLKGNFIRQLAGVCFKNLFSRSAKKAALVSVTNESEGSEVLAIRKTSLIIVPNGISRERFEDFSRIPLPTRLDSENFLRLGYFGNVGIAQKLHQLIDWTCNDERIRIMIIGDGADLQFLKQKCTQAGINNVSFTGHVCLTELKEYLVDLHILFAQIGEEYATAIPSKVFEYIASGRKIILGLPNGPAKHVFGRFKGVYIFSAEEESSFREAFKKCISDHMTISDINENRDLLRLEFLRETGAGKMVDAVVDSSN